MKSKLISSPYFEEFGLAFRTLFAIVFCLALFPQRAFSWGDEGHSITALVAQKVLTEQSKKNPQAKKALATVKKILGSTSFDEAAIWPDKVKSLARECSQAPYVKDPTWGKPPYVGKSSAICDAYAFTSSWHFIDSDNSKYVLDPTSTEYFKGDVVIMATGLSHLLKGEAAPVLAGVTSYDNWKAQCLKKADHDCKKEALEFLIHFMGDIHQPLHSGANCDLGGNNQQINFFGQTDDPTAFWCAAKKPTDPKAPDYNSKLATYQACVHHELHQDWDVNLFVHQPHSRYKSNATYASQISKTLAKAKESSDADHCVRVAPSAKINVDGANGIIEWINESLCYLPQAYRFPDDSSAQAASKEKPDNRKVAEQTVHNRCVADRAVKALDDTGKVILNKDGTERIAYYKPYEIGPKYIEANLKTVDERLYWGGARLANLLIDIYGNGDKATDFEK